MPPFPPAADVASPAPPPPPPPRGPAGGEARRPPPARAGRPGRAAPAVAAIAPQDSARAAVLARPRRPVGAISDQWAPQQQVGGRIDHSQDGLLEGLQRRGIRGLSGRIRAPRPAQGLHKLGLEPRRLSAN